MKLNSGKQGRATQESALWINLEYSYLMKLAPTKSEVFVVLPDDGRSAPGAIAISEGEADTLMADQ